MAMPRCFFSSACLMCTLILAPGCSSGPKEESTVKVTGEVQLDGKPMNDGEIIFVGESGTVPNVIPIQNGTFAGTATPGKKTVKIHAYRTGKPPPTATDSVGEFKENYIPDRFNVNSKLTAEVTASGVNPSKFEVQSK